MSREILSFWACVKDNRTNLLYRVWAAYAFNLIVYAMSHDMPL